MYKVEDSDIISTFHPDTLRLYRVLRTLEGKRITGLVPQPKRHMILVSAQPNYLALIDPRSINIINQYTGLMSADEPTCPCYSPDGSFCFCSDDDGTLHAWGSHSGKLADSNMVKVDFPGAVVALDFHPTQQLVAAGCDVANTSIMLMGANGDGTTYDDDDK
eukprot:TRINITY_DN401_c0_g1_i4.p1 TRINITY_DN401_c0_g1~~TRINITY_DN401_c0_g1_i4.p1  ORF type:complete len:162 (-),score=46.62 TRINITY_DN401_c0_g1_i4:501-986(-)